MTDKMREAFEDYASDGGKWSRAIATKGGNYVLMSTEFSWRAWQSAWQAALAEQPAQGEAVALTGDQIARHTLDAGECPPNSQVILVSSIRRLAARNTAPPVPSVTVPEGWKLVPVDAPDEMLRWLDGGIRVAFSMRETLRRRYAALLAAAAEVKP